jgi:hypothetical protein
MVTGLVFVPAELVGLEEHPAASSETAAAAATASPNLLERFIAILLS